MQRNRHFEGKGKEGDYVEEDEDVLLMWSFPGIILFLSLQQFNRALSIAKDYVRNPFIGPPSIDVEVTDTTGFVKTDIEDQ